MIITMREPTEEKRIAEIDERIREIRGRIDSLRQRERELGRLIGRACADGEDVTGLRAARRDCRDEMEDQYAAVAHLEAERRPGSLSF